MADFAEHGEIIARCIEYEENEFIETYFENIEIQNDEVIESSIVANALIDFMEEKDEWEGPATMLYSTLSNFIENREGTLRKNNLWPNAPNALSRKINELAPTLKEKGIEITHNYNNKRKGRQIKIINLQKISSLSSYRSSCSDDSNLEKDDNFVEENNNTLCNFETNAEDKEYDNNQFEIKNTSSIVVIDNTSQTNDLMIDANTSNITPATIVMNDLQNNNSNGFQLNIHNIANRLYEGSNIWLCKTCDQRGDKWYILDHNSDCKMNKKL